MKAAKRKKDPCIKLFPKKDNTIDFLAIKPSSFINSMNELAVVFMDDILTGTIYLEYTLVHLLHTKM